MKFTYWGHATFSVVVGGTKLLFDPFVTPNPLAKDIDIKTIGADYILISHGHGDHIADAAAIAEHTGATVICAPEVAAWLKKQGVTRIHEMNFGSYTFDFGTVTMVPAAHSSGLPDGSYGGNPGGFVVRSAEKNFYYSGDTSLTMEMQLIPFYAKPDFAVLPIGGNYTMNAEEALRCAEMIHCDKIIGVHYDSFPVISIDREDAKSRFTLANKELLLPGIGESLDI
ncbi:metal-dependent hydrolase [Rurimicrobium arvi]